MFVLHVNNARYWGAEVICHLSETNEHLVLQVATRSANSARQENAQAVLSEITGHSSNLVNQTKLVSEELIRIAILWHEQWHEALEEASRLYFGEQDVEGMLHTLLPLHAKLNAVLATSPTGETRSEKLFKMVWHFLTIGESSA